MAIEDTEVNKKFRERTRQAMVVSYHKYGAVRDAFPHKVSAIESLKLRLKLYEESGNADYLVDIANFAEIEFTLPAHPKFHDNPTDGGEGRYWHAGGGPTEKRNDGGRN